MMSKSMVRSSNVCFGISRSITRGKMASMDRKKYIETSFGFRTLGGGRGVASAGGQEMSRSSGSAEDVKQKSDIGIVMKKKASAIPTPDEDREVAHEAFLHAFQEAQPQKARIPGMQDFASAILARARIPSQQYSDPLMHIFDEFDKDNDGCLTASEVGEALRSRNVQILDEQVQMFIDTVDLNNSHQVEKQEWRDLIMHMAAADLHSRQQEAQVEEAEWDRCSLESEEEIQDKLKGWTQHLMFRRYK